MEILGLDIGGSGIKGAIVNVHTGELLSERHRLATPKPATPKAVAETVQELVAHFSWKGYVGCGFPTVVKNGQCRSHGNLSPEWVGVQVDQLFGEHCPGATFAVSNDADVAGIAEMELGAGKGKMGKVILITVGTGIGSGVFYDGTLIPNVELGRILHTDGQIIEWFASDAARKRDGLKVREWAPRFDLFLHQVVEIYTPDLFIIGGGISKKFDKYKDLFTVKVPIVPADFRNSAGIVGAAALASRVFADVKS
ncbi:MAG: ROK family protein [Bacteroidota bacterium]